MVAYSLRKERKDKLLSSIIEKLSSDSYQLRPYLPNLLRQPDLLIVPELGRMIVVFLYSSSQVVGWRAALMWLEDLIEVKLEAGNHVVVIALVVAEVDDVRPDDEVAMLLHNVFDSFLSRANGSRIFSIAICIVCWFSWALRLASWIFYNAKAIK